ncbi:hypothetical protein MY4824_009111 [Beauveria thailandica]
MARSASKRKCVPETEVSEDDFDGHLEGILSQSEDEEGEFDESDGEPDLDDGSSDDLPEDPDEDDDEKNETPKSKGENNEHRPYKIVTDANGGVRYEYEEIDPIYDSDDSDAQGPVNTIGNIPLSFYDSYPHIGYDINGKKIMRPATGETLDALLESIELPKGWTGLTDPETGKPLNLSQDELELLRKLQMNEVPEEGYDPYPEMVPYFTSIEEKMPLSAAPEPKRRFVPSRHEAKRVAQLVRAIKEGKILPYKPADETDSVEEQAETYYDIWANEEPQDRGVMHIPAPKLAPPGYDLSYNPPPEYLPTHEEKQAWEDQDPESREKEYLPQKYDALRRVPGYGEFVKERFERCLDLYLAPRVRKNRLNIDPNSLLPKLPRPEELKPFPSLCQTIFRGHDGRVRTVAFSPNGEWIASGGDDGTVRVWALNGHEEWSAKLSSEEPVQIVRWRPVKDTFILAAAAGEDLFFACPPLASDAIEKASRDVLDAGFGYAAGSAQHKSATVKKEGPAKWARPGAKLENAGVLLKATVRSVIKTVDWHRRGDFLCTVSPTGQRSSVAIHTLSKHLSQIPFRRLPGLAQTAHFHPSRPLFFVATQRMIRCYDLQRQELVKVVQPGARWISSFDIHPGGDNLIVGSYDRRLLWHDMDLSSRPYKTMRFHVEAIRAVKYHRSLPLFADASDDGSLQIFHGKVVSDLMENATIVPVKMLKGHRVVSKLGVMDVDWHPKHPWCISAGADGTCRLWA